MVSDDKVFSHEPPLEKFIGFFVNMIEKPVIWFRENVVVPNRKEYYWYHEKLRRVPTIDECYTDDIICIYEANEQYKRDRQVEKFILHILKKRSERCALDNKYDREECEELRKIYHRAADNYFIKYGDLGFKGSAVSCLMKQKNRMAWERRHGEVGTGRKPRKTEATEVKTDTTC